jgi:hypothetical protein
MILRYSSSVAVLQDVSQRQQSPTWTSQHLLLPFFQLVQHFLLLPIRLLLEPVGSFLRFLFDLRHALDLIKQAVTHTHETLK